jgi:predicted nucleic acid-binding protein
MKQSLYIDTSVFGGYFDEEFSEFTRPLFERLQNGEFRILFSAVTQDELDSAPERVKKLVTSLKTEHTEFMEMNDEAVELATQYIAEKVVGQASFAD